MSDTFPDPRRMSDEQWAAFRDRLGREVRSEQRQAATAMWTWVARSLAAVIRAATARVIGRRRAVAVR